MIKVSVLYPNSTSSKFDMDYYCNRHIPMLQRELGKSCKRVVVEEGLIGASPDLPPAFIAIGHLYFKSLETYQSAFDPHLGTIMRDISKYTNVKPTIQISKVKIHRRRRDMSSD